ncbi:unnamed protein product [Sphagnum balticum]|jgi:hypothetical protein
MYYYETVSHAVSELSKRGYTVNFNLSAGHLSWIEHGINLKPDEFNIDEVYRFEGDTDPGDEMVIYAISSGSKGLKGILVNAFGVYADQLSDELMAKLRQSH